MQPAEIIHRLHFFVCISRQTVYDFLHGQALICLTGNDGDEDEVLHLQQQATRDV